MPAIVRISIFGRTCEVTVDDAEEVGYDGLIEAVSQAINGAWPEMLRNHTLVRQQNQVEVGRSRTGRNQPEMYNYSIPTPSYVRTEPEAAQAVNMVTPVRSASEEINFDLVERS